jgi:integrase
MATSDIADMPLANITQRDVKRWRDALKSKQATHRHKGAPGRALGRKLSRHTVDRAHALLSACFEAAKDENYMTQNPARGIKRVRKQEGKTRDPWSYLRLSTTYRSLTPDWQVSG